MIDYIYCKVTCVPVLNFAWLVSSSYGTGGAG